MNKPDHLESWVTSNGIHFDTFEEAMDDEVRTEVSMFFTVRGIGSVPPDIFGAVVDGLRDLARIVVELDQIKEEITDVKKDPMRDALCYACGNSLNR